MAICENTPIQTTSKEKQSPLLRRAGCTDPCSTTSCPSSTITTGMPSASKSCHRPEGSDQTVVPTPRKKIERSQQQQQRENFEPRQKQLQRAGHPRAGTKGAKGKMPVEFTRLALPDKQHRMLLLFVSREQQRKPRQRNV